MRCPIAPIAFGNRELLEERMKEDIGLGQGGHELHIAAIAFGERKLLEEPGETQVEYRPALAAGLMPQGACQPGFALLMTMPSWG